MLYIIIIVLVTGVNLRSNICMSDIIRRVMYNQDFVFFYSKSFGGLRGLGSDF